MYDSRNSNNKCFPPALLVVYAAVYLIAVHRVQPERQRLQTSNRAYCCRRWSFAVRRSIFFIDHIVSTPLRGRDYDITNIIIRRGRLISKAQTPHWTDARNIFNLEKIMALCRTIRRYAPKQLFTLRGNYAYQE